ncbi:MAG: four helix bundle protein [Planctomycetes bacterium]|jgi:four helix bundle protein|nr:four helix bundle protein [Planctomycetota bacterium]
MSDQDQANELEDRLIDFGARIINLAMKMPDIPAGQHIANQILRSGTSPAPNYAEARSGESKRDFVHKLGIVLKELNETKVWLKMTARSKLLPATRLVEIKDECEQLCKVIASSRRTSRNNLKR